MISNMELRIPGVWDGEFKISVIHRIKQYANEIVTYVSPIYVTRIKPILPR